MSGIAGAHAPRLRLAISFAGLRLMLQEMRAKGVVPMAILVSPFDGKDLKREITDTALQVLPDAWDTVDDSIGFIEGIMVTTHPAVERGKCKLIPKFELFNAGRWVSVM